jgi:hypothetical protein
VAGRHREWLDPDLAHVLDAQPSLPPPIRAADLALVQVAGLLTGRAVAGKASG